MAGLWQIVVPEATTNLFDNPSFETGTTGWTLAGAGASAVRGTVYQKFGAYGVLLTQGGAGCQYYQTLSPGAVPTTLSFFARNAAGTAIGGLTAWFNNASVLVASTTSIGNGWYYYTYTATPTAGARQFGIQLAVGAAALYIDSFQLETKAYATTYADGSQPGCVWTGAAHGSTSTRDALSRAGGKVTNLDDFGFYVSGVVGIGMPPVQNLVDEYALLPGGNVQGNKVLPRSFVVEGLFGGASAADLNAKRQSLINVVKPDAVPDTATGPQPVRLRYIGAAVHKEINAHYEGGIDGNVAAEYPCSEEAAVRFFAADPFFYEIGDPAVALGSVGSATFSYIGARLHTTGQWSNLGNVGTGTVFAIAEDETYIYVGGSFINWNAIAAADYIVRYNKATAVWSALGTGMNASVEALIIAPDGRLYAGGGFTTAGGGAANYIAVWNGAAWSALGAGMDASVYSLAIVPDGRLYAGGAFTTAGGGAANRIAVWNGAAWAALGSGVGAAVYTIAITPSGNLYAGGAFTTAGGSPANYIAMWNGAAWSTLGSGMNADVRALVVAQDGRLYAGGSFTTAGGITVNYITVWNGATWSALGSGVNDWVYSLAIAPDGKLYVGGIFTAAGTLTLTDRCAIWNGSTYIHLDIDFPGAAVGHTLLIQRYYTSAVVAPNYSAYIGFNTTGTTYYSGTVTATNAGTETAYPKFVIKRSGGTTALVTQIRNETTGKAISCNYSLLDGETLTIDLAPTKKSIVSSFFGSVPRAVLAASDVGSFALRPGTNQITSFVNVTGAPTITANMEWRNSYWSFD